jgi:ABC-2 type transport system ATP-binding protein
VLIAARDERPYDLIRRIGTEFGIAVVVCSHLLGEIERVCDHVVAIDAGRLLRSAPLASFTGRTGTLIVEMDDGADQLAADLVAAGYRAQVDGPRRVLIAARDERPYDLIRDAAASRGLALIRIEAARHRVEDLFRDDPNGEGARGSAA